MDLLQRQEQLDAAVRGCIELGMTEGDLLDWVLDTLRQMSDE